MNGIDIILIIIIAAVVFFAVRKLYKDRKQGKICSGCGGECGGRVEQCGKKK